VEKVLEEWRNSGARLILLTKLMQDLRKDARCRVGSNKPDTNRRMFEFFNQAIRKPLVFQLVNGLRTQHS
jgi:hypothetical protein